MIEDLVEHMVVVRSMMIHVRTSLSFFGLLHRMEIRKAPTQLLSGPMHEHADSACAHAQLLADLRLTHLLDALQPNRLGLLPRQARDLAPHPLDELVPFGLDGRPVCRRTHGRRLVKRNDATRFGSPPPEAVESPSNREPAKERRPAQDRLGRRTRDDLGEDILKAIERLGMIPEDAVHGSPNERTVLFSNLWPIVHPGVPDWNRSKVI